MSTHAVRVVRLGEIKTHPYADSLGTVDISGYTCVVKLSDWKPGDLAVYIEPDYIVPEAPEFAFLGEHRRIKARRLRGIYSQGLLMPARDGMAEGDDVMTALGITRYVPPDDGVNHERENPCASLGNAPVYDIENLYGTLPSGRTRLSLLTPGEQVVVTEKIDGCNSRFAWRDGRMWVGSRNEWKRQGTGEFWKALEHNRWIETWCQTHPDWVLYGEVYRVSKKCAYGLEPGQIGFRAFDILTGPRTWADAGTMLTDGDLRLNHCVPYVYNGSFDLTLIRSIAEADSEFGSYRKEGVVIKPAAERIDPELGRVVFKLISNRYMEKS